MRKPKSVNQVPFCCIQARDQQLAAVNVALDRLRLSNRWLEGERTSLASQLGVANRELRTLQSDKRELQAAVRVRHTGVGRGGG
jgi:hypothetical protein